MEDKEILEQVRIDKLMQLVCNLEDCPDFSLTLYCSDDDTIVITGENIRDISICVIDYLKDISNFKPEDILDDEDVPF